MKQKISVVIPVYKNKELLIKLFKNNWQYIKNLEILIIDDASGENIKDFFEREYSSVRVIVNKKNLGFASNVNKAFKYVNGDYVLLLNSDVKLLDDSFLKAYKEMENDTKIFAESFAQIEKTGEIVGKNIVFFKKGFFHHSKASDLKYGENGWAEGGAVLIRKKHFNDLSGFLDIYSPFYWEDVDLSFRAKKIGLKVIFNPNIKVEHCHESTIGKYFDKDFINTIAFRNQFIFTWKNSNIFQLFEHFIYLLYSFFIFLIKGNINFHNGLFLAAFRIIFFKKNED